MSKRKGPNTDNLEETRRIFLEVGLQEFREYGYADASTSRIVKNSDMARGSLYYHFGDKKGLFYSIYEEMMHDALIVLSKEMDVQKDSWSAFMIGASTFLDLCIKPDFRRIVLVESQSALTIQERFVVQEKTLWGKLQTILPDMLNLGHFPGHTRETASIFIMGILSEIGRSFDFAKDIQQARLKHEKAFKETMECLKA